MSIASDLKALYADTFLTVPVVFGAQATRGFLDWQDAPQTDASGEIVLVSQRTLTLRVGSLTGLANDSTLVVDGTSYTVHDLRRINDGRELQVVLA